MRLVAEMLSQLRRHRSLDKPFGQLREHTARPDDLLLGPGAREQLVDHLVGETIANRFREAACSVAAPPAGRCARPPGSLRNPPALSTPAASIRSVSVLAFVDMTLLISSCLHRGSDTPNPELSCARHWSVGDARTRPPTSETSRSGPCAVFELGTGLGPTTLGPVECPGEEREERRRPRNIGARTVRSASGAMGLCRRVRCRANPKLCRNCRDLDDAANIEQGDD